MVLNQGEYMLNDNAKFRHCHIEKPTHFLQKNNSIATTEIR